MMTKGSPGEWKRRTHFGRGGWEPVEDMLSDRARKEGRQRRFTYDSRAGLRTMSMRFLMNATNAFFRFFWASMSKLGDPNIPGNMAPS